MKKILNLGLCVVLVCGLVISPSTAQEKQETQKKVQEKEQSEIKELTIRNSGFRSRSTIVIRYQDKDKKIVAVTENGKELPPEEFSRYESVMRTVLELPQIDRLLPDIDRAYRRAESPLLSAESKLREMTALSRSLAGLNSDVARRYQDMTKLQLMANLNLLTEKISGSKELYEEEKIAKLKDVIEKMQALLLPPIKETLLRGLVESRAAIAERRLIEEIKKSSGLSKEEKIKEIQSLVEKTRNSELETERRRMALVEIEAEQAIRKMLEDIAKDKELSDLEKEKEFNSLIQEIKKINSENIRRMVGIQKFEFELSRFLKQKGLFPEGKAEFILKSKVSSIDGKQLPKEIHQEIMKLCEECIGKKFTSTTQIVLQLNNNR